MCPHVRKQPPQPKGPLTLSRSFPHIISKSKYSKRIGFLFCVKLKQTVWMTFLLTPCRSWPPSGSLLLLSLGVPHSAGCREAEPNRELAFQEPGAMPPMMAGSWRAHLCFSPLLECVSTSAIESPLPLWYLLDGHRFLFPCSASQLVHPGSCPKLAPLVLPLRNPNKKIFNNS